MPTPLTDDASTFPAVVVPAAGDPRGYASVQTPFQALANRTRQTKNRVDVIAPATDGVRLVRTVANDAALLAISAGDTMDAQLAIVKDVGLYQFDSTSTLSAQAPVVRAPTYVGGGAGRWILIAAGRGVLNAANGIAQCDATGRVPAASIRNGHIYDKSSIGEGTSTSGGILPSTPITFAGLVPGDSIKFVFSIRMTPPPGHNAGIQANIVDPATGPAAVAGCSFEITAPASAPPLAGIPLGCCGFFDVINPGDHSLHLFASTDGTAATYFNAITHAWVVRP